MLEGESDLSSWLWPGEAIVVVFDRFGDNMFFITVLDCSWMENKRLIHGCYIYSTGNSVLR